MSALWRLRLLIAGLCALGAGLGFNCGWMVAGMRHRRALADAKEQVEYARERVEQLRERCGDAIEDAYQEAR